MSEKKSMRSNADGLGYTGQGHPTRTEPEVYKKQTRALGLIKRFLWVVRYWPDGLDIGPQAVRALAYERLPFIRTHIRDIRPDWVSAADIEKGFQDLCGSTNLWKYKPPYSWDSMLPDTRQEVRAVMEIMERGLVVQLRDVDALVNRQSREKS